MRILDGESDKKLDNVSIFLTAEEALQLRSYLDQLLENPKLQHSHLSSADYQKEITICVYDIQNLNHFDKRTKKLLKEDR